MSVESKRWKVFEFTPQERAAIKSIKGEAGGRLRITRREADAVGNHLRCLMLQATPHPTVIMVVRDLHRRYMESSQEPKLTAFR